MRPSSTQRVAARCVEIADVLGSPRRRGRPDRPTTFGPQPGVVACGSRAGSRRRARRRCRRRTEALAPPRHRASTSARKSRLVGEQRLRLASGGDGAPPEASRRRPGARRRTAESRVPASAEDDTVEPAMPKTLTGEELQLDDAPARDSELFLVDGNNLAYRAYFALPEELATSEGMPTNALLGFTNMLFKLLTDYRPEGRRGRLGHAAGRADGAARGLQGRPAADGRPPPRAVPALPADRRGLRVPQPRVRGLGGRRRHRHARHACRPGGSEDDRRLHRPRRLPARHGERDADDDAERASRTSTSTRPSAWRPASGSRPTRSPTSSASRGTPRTTSRASRGSATRPRRS